MPSTDLETAATLLDFVELYLADEQAGRPRELAHYVARFPGHAAAVEAEFHRLERTAGSTDEPTGWDLDAGTSVALLGADDSLGTYRIVRELGRGGQAIVYLARDERLGRHVALKVLRTPFEGAAAWRDRLRREVRIVAGLDHPGLCTVYQADIERDPPCIAMRYVEGWTLGALVRSRRGADDAGEPCRPRSREELDRLLALVEQAARALHVAHEQGVVHRDIKPGNIMATPEGTAVVLDFGLARRTGPDWKELTGAGEAFGTPAYMSPEQVRGQPVDRTTDVYSLGVTLFECLTLRRPFDGPSRAAMEHAILEQPVPDRALHDADVPRDVRIVIKRALAKEPARRYPTAEAFADDLARVRRREPIHARPVGVLERLLLWSRRDPVLALSLGALLVTLTAGLVSSLVLYLDGRDALRRVEALRLASEARRTVEDAPYTALLMALESLELEPTAEANTALCSALADCRLESILPGGARIRALATDASHDLVAIGREDGSWAVWDTALRSVRRRGREGAPVSDAAFTPDGALLLATLGAGARLVHPDDPSRDGPRLAQATTVTGAVALDDGRLVLCGDRGALQVVPAASRGRSADPIPPDGAVARVVADARGDLVLTHADRGGPGGEEVLLRDLASPDAPGAVFRHASAVTCARLSPDARTVVTAGQDGRVLLWEADRVAPRAVLERAGRVQAVCFSPDGRLLATCSDPDGSLTSDDAGLALWDVATGSLVRELSGHEGRLVNDAAFSPDGSLLASVGYDGHARLWDVGTGEEVRRLGGVLARLYRVRWLSGGARLVGSGDSHAMVWRLDSRDVVVLEGHEGAVLDARFTPDGAHVATVGADWTVRVWRADDGGGPRRLDLADAPTGIDVDRTGRVVVGTASGDARLWAPFDERPAVTLPHGTAPVTVVRVDDDGSRVVTGAEDGTVVLWDARTGRRLLDLAGHDDAVTCAAFAPGSRRLATGGADRHARVWDTADGRALHALSGWDEPAENPRWQRVFDVRFAGRDDVLLAAGEDGRIREWRLAPTGAVLTRADPLTAGFVAALEDGTLVATSKWRGVAWVRDPGGGSRTVEVHDNRITSAVLSPDRSLLLTTSLDGTASLVTVPEFARVVDYRGHGSFVSSGHFSPDGRRVVTTGRDGTARVWPVDVEGAARRRMPIRVGGDG